MAVKERRFVADYLKVPGEEGEGTYAFMGTGFETLDDQPAAQTRSKKYINDKSTTKSISGYDWTAPFTTDLIKGEEAIDFIKQIGEKEMTGEDAETEYVKVDLDAKVGSSGTEYEARMRKVAVEVASFYNNDGEIQASGNLLGKGDWTAGKFDTTTKTFTAEGDDSDIGA